MGYEMPVRATMLVIAHYMPEDPHVCTLREVDLYMLVPR